MNDIEKVINYLRNKNTEAQIYFSDCKRNYDEETEEMFQMHDIAIQALEEKQKRQWIPVSERLPEPEVEVEVTVKRKYENKESTFTCRAMYENGEIWREDSIFCWNDFDNVEYDEEKDDYKVPEGWFESVSYAEEFAVIDDFVIAWRELPEPYKEDK